MCTGYIIITKFQTKIALKELGAQYKPGGIKSRPDDDYLNKNHRGERRERESRIYT